MFEVIGKNLWVMLTIIIPGFFTYGLWRILLFLQPVQVINYEQLKDIDESGLVTICIITAIALLQQIVGIFIEFILALIAKLNKNSWGDLHSFFWDRFKYASKGLLNKNSTRIIGNCFLSINIFVGLVILVCYFTLFELLPLSHWIPILLLLFLAIDLVVIPFRIHSALSVFKEIKQKNNK